jgi:predicted solute-binding protein
MYVNDYTVRLGDEGLQALTRLYTDAYRRKLIPGIPPLDVV